MNLHPGAIAALTMLSADELGVARLMASGDAVSPQQFHNMWLYCMRITGTGVSYRPQLNEFVMRRPENYLTPEFLSRCNGLPVVKYHPEKKLLDSDEFAASVIGTVMLPYIQGDEVWAVSKVFDDDAIGILQTEQMSTSPGVVIGKDSIKVEMKDGSKLLIEGKPAFVDHLATCSRGVWDKGGDPSGIKQDDLIEARTDSIDSYLDKMNMLNGAVKQLQHKATMLQYRTYLRHR